MELCGTMDNGRTMRLYVIRNRTSINIISLHSTPRVHANDGFSGKTIDTWSDIM